LLFCASFRLETARLNLLLLLSFGLARGYYGNTGIGKASAS
jgi:hypothetical protein